MHEKVTNEEEKVLLRKFVNRALNEPRLTSWEREFLTSIGKQIIVRDLSEKQINAINKIKQKYDKK